jgi:hypothetical protein
MTTISANMIEYSASQEDIRLPTILTRYPRFIHAEVMTHRVFSRNASSSRAIPVLRLLRDILRDPAMPIHWGKNQAGMQAREELSPFKKFIARNLWVTGMYLMVTIAWLAHMLGAHKQIVNRLVEPWSHINVLITATEWENFFELRDHPDAQPEIMILAQAIKFAMESSTPRLLQPGEWHLPFVTALERSQYEIETLVKLSIARCARTSYMTYEGTVPQVDQDIKLYDRLVGARPLHASPAEHQATPDVNLGVDESGQQWLAPFLSGNFRKGWRQGRKILEQAHA